MTALRKTALRCTALRGTAFGRTPFGATLFYATLFAATLFAATPSFSADFSTDARGTSTAQFLKLGAGARAVGMGNAFAAVADDATALYWNPAGLASVPGTSASFMHAPYLDSTSFEYLAAAKRFDDNVLAVGVQYFSAGAIPRRSATNADLGSYSPYDLALSVGYARKVEDSEWQDIFNIGAVGVSAKLIQSHILATAQAEALDVGFRSVGYFDDQLHIGLTATNIGTGMRFEQQTDPLPMTFRAGAAWKVTDGWLLSADLVAPRDNSPHGAFGTEFSGGDEDLRWAVRAGYDSTTNNNVPGLTGAAVGAGVTYNGIGIDYAIAPFGDLGLTHRISLSIAFGDDTP